MAKQRIHTIKNKILVQGDENLLTNNEILVTETPEGVSLKERTSEGIKTISGGGGGEGNTIYVKVDISLFPFDIPEDDEGLLLAFYQFLGEAFLCPLYKAIGHGYSGNMVSLPWMNLNLLGFGGYFNRGTSSNSYINEKYVGFFEIPFAFIINDQLDILNPYMSDFICYMVRAKQPTYFKIDLAKCIHYSRESSYEDPKINIIDIDSTKISKYSDILKKHPMMVSMMEQYPPESFEYIDTLVTIVSKEEVDRVFDMYCEMFFAD